MVDRKLISAVLTILMVVVSELLWPPTAAVKHVANPTDGAQRDWSVELQAHRHDPPRRPRVEDLPHAHGAMPLPYSLVSLLSEGTNWALHAAGDDVRVWSALAGDAVSVNEAEGYVTVEFADLATVAAGAEPLVESEDGVDKDDDNNNDAATSRRAATRGLQAMACEEYRGGGGVSLSGAASAAGQRRRRERGARTTRVTGRCFLTLDNVADVSREPSTVMFTYVVVPSAAHVAEETAAKTARGGAARAAAARRSKAAVGKKDDGTSPTAEEARVLDGVSGWLQLEVQEDAESVGGQAHGDEEAAGEAGTARAVVGAVTVRQGVMQSHGADGRGGFKATIQLFFFPDKAAQERGLAPLFPVAVELAGVHGAYARAQEVQKALGHKATVTSTWYRYVSPVLLALGVYGVARVLNGLLTRWLDKKQRQSSQASASTKPAPGQQA